MFGCCSSLMTHQIYVLYVKVHIFSTLHSPNTFGNAIFHGHGLELTWEINKNHFDKKNQKPPKNHKDGTVFAKLATSASVCKFALFTQRKTGLVLKLRVKFIRRAYYRSEFKCLIWTVQQKQNMSLCCFLKPSCSHDIVKALCNKWPTVTVLFNKHARHLHDGQQIKTGVAWHDIWQLCKC